MLFAQNRQFNGTVTRLWAVFALTVASGLVFAAAPGSVAANSGRRAGAGRAERSNHRMRVPSAAAMANAVKPMSFPLLFAPIDVDRTDDTAAASACTAAPNDCSLRGAVAFANLNPGTTINVPAGTYQLNIPGGVVEGFTGNNAIGDLDIRGNNTIIAGAGASTTTIQQTQPNDRVIEVNPDLLASFNFDISGVTITGGKETTAVGGGGIISGSINNTMSVTDCVLSNNSATGVGTLGGGGILHTGGSLTITGTTFSNNSTSTSGGGLGYTAGDPLIRTPSTGTLSISGSTFSGNTANSVAAGGGGADLFNFNAGSGTYSINSSSFSNNSAPNGSGGAIIVESGPLTVTTSSLAGNTAGVAGGAISSNSSTSVTFSRLVGNTVPNPLNGLSLFAAAGSFTADDNWWGINTGPSANDFRNIGGPVFPMTYLQLRIGASPNELCSGGTSTITADIKQRNLGSPLTTELNGLPTFMAVFHNVVGGSVSGTTNFVNGVATGTFTAGGTSGPASVDVTGDNQTVTANMTIDANETTDPADQVVCEGQTATFTTTASGPGPITFVWKKGATVLNNGDLGGRVTITSGSNSSTLSISGTVVGDSATYTVEAIGQCSTATQSATLTVNANTQTTDPADQSVCQGTDAHFSTVASGTGPFSYAWTLDGNPVGANSPNVTIPTGALSPGNHTVTVTTTGACGSATQTAILSVNNGTPVITLSTTSATMWPPNHQYRTFSITDFVASASSSCDSSVDINDVVIQKVSSDEPEENPLGADGNTLNDIVIAPDCKSVELRRERDGNLNGRVYTITFKVSDSFGNSTTTTVKVSVPKNNGGTAIDNGAAAGYTVNSLCP
ncbi:MAG TPA: immunoglobulin domain-containing protein [Pyrinomonadaceae bacterium]|nr:immunoglobulin domain-containing protein [Pyrinomonadaceae bacterium]